MLTLLVFLAVLSVLVLSHELGHFLAAKKAGIKVEEFGLGYPPRIWSKKIGETVYSINLLPLGGFVRLFGEEIEEKDKIKGKDAHRAFWAKSKKARTAVILAGVVANFLLAVVVFTIIYSDLGIPTQTGQVTVLGVAPESPAARAGLKEKDVVVSVDRAKIASLGQFMQLVDGNKDKPVSIEVKRSQDNPCHQQVLGGMIPSGETTPTYTCNGSDLVLTVTPRANPPAGEGPLGVAVSDVQLVHYPWWQMPFRGAVQGFKEAFSWAGLVLDGLKRTMVDLFSHGQVPQDIAGPIGIFQITGQARQAGFLPVLQLIGIISVNLMVVNALPFPALDGGQLMFIVYELVVGKQPKPEFKRWVNSIGMAILLLLVALVSLNDISRLWKTSALAVKLRSLWPF